MGSARFGKGLLYWLAIIENYLGGLTHGYICHPFYALQIVSFLILCISVGV